jgi:formate dehydrogenase major subunit
MTLSRRQLLKVGGGAGVGLALAELGFDTGLARAAAREMKLVGASEYTTACNFCSCGCGMIGHVQDGKLVSLEGDPGHVINQGSLCTKGAAMRATHESPRRMKVPLYRAPGSDRWEEISWDQALAKVSRKIKETRDTSWVATQNDGHVEYPVNRTDAIAFLGGAQNTNEECYLINKMGRLFGTSYIEHQARL